MRLHLGEAWALDRQRSGVTGKGRIVTLCQFMRAAPRIIHQDLVVIQHTFFLLFLLGAYLVL